MDYLNRYTRMKLEKLKFETGCNIVAANGQRRLGPPEIWIGLPPPRGSEVFIGNLPRDLFEYDLYPVFSRVGRIYQLRMVINYSGSNRGFGFVIYSSINEAERAIQELDGYAIRPNWHISVLKSVDNCRLYLRDIPENKSKEEILTELNKFVTGIVDIKLYNNNLFRAFMYVEFASYREAALARRTLVPGVSAFFNRVYWTADYRPDIEQENPRNHRAEYARSVDNRSQIPLEYTNIYELYEMCKRMWCLRSEGQLLLSLTKRNAVGPSVLVFPEFYDHLTHHHNFKYGWPRPEYFCRMHNCCSGYQGCISYLDVLGVKLPWVHAPACFTFTSKICNTYPEAHEDAAEQAVQYLKERNTSTPRPLLPCYQGPTTNVYNTRGYNFTNYEMHQSAPLAPPAAHWN